MTFGNRSIGDYVLMLRADGIPPTAPRRATTLRATRLFKVEEFAACVPSDTLVAIGSEH